MNGILTPLKGKTISCSPSTFIYGYAMVDANGNPFTRATNGTNDTGWVSGFYANNGVGTSTSWNIPLMTVVSGAKTCTAYWPNN